MKHLKYLSYILRHKWFVLIAGLRIGAPFWRLIVHDWSKMLPCEWSPYAEWFYGKKKSREWFDLQSKYGCAELAPWGASVEDHFKEAWLHHLHFNPHHWQYWILRNDDGSTSTLPMPEKFIREMVADWMGAGRAITGQWEATTWYIKNETRMQLNNRTRQRVESLLCLPARIEEV